ncbi:hypothetical protein EDC96DRAFT_538521 [Choanephora cucurbitarum]|nr:hypothetical protein EDC96DRAFT_538521 [Choanephora cucurbitarum]
MRIKVILLLLDSIIDCDIWYATFLNQSLVFTLCSVRRFFFCFLLFSITSYFLSLLLALVETDAVSLLFEAGVVLLFVPVIVIVPF